MIAGSTCVGVTTVSKVLGSSNNVSGTILNSSGWGHLAAPSVLNPETFNSGTVSAGAEPFTMILVGLGLIGLQLAGRSFFKR